MLIRRDNFTVIALLIIHGRVDIEKLNQPIKHLFRQLLALLIEAFLVFPYREADYSILPHKDVFLVGTGDQAVAGFSVGGVHGRLVGELRGGTLTRWMITY
jgi:hypothetical protein